MFKKIISIVCCLTLYFNSFAYAIVGVPDTNHWEFRWFGGGGSFPMIVPDNFVSGKFYLVSDVGNPMVTLDSGEHWTWLSYSSANGLLADRGSAFLQSKNDPNLMFTVGGDTNRGGVAKTSDGAQTWKRVHTAPATRTSSSKMIQFSPTTDNIIYAAFNNGWVARSVDKGESFQNLYRPNLTTVSAETAELNIPSNPTNPNTRTGSLNNTNNLIRGTVVFTSSGETFTDSTTGTSGVLTGSAGGTGSISYSNGSYTLNFFSTPTATTVAYQYAPKAGWLWVNPTDTKIFTGQNGGGGLKIYDMVTTIVTPVTLTPNTPNPQYNFPKYQEDYDTYVDGSNVTHFCTSAGLQIACTSDDGQNWEYTGDVQSANTASSQYKIHRFTVRYLSTGQVRYTAFINLVTSSSSQSRVRTSVGGTTWTSSSFTRNFTDNPTFPGTGNHDGNNLVSDPFNENVLFFTTNFTVYRSDNGGVSFVEKVKGAGQTVLSDIKVAPNGTLVGCSMDIGCQKSVDHGLTWTNIFPKGAPDPGVPYIGGHFWQLILLGTEEDWNNGQGRIIMTSNYWYDFIPRIHRCTNNGDTCTTSKLTAIDGKTINIGLYGDVIWDRGYIRALAKSKDETVLYAATDGANCDADGSGGLPSDQCSATGNNHVYGGLFRSLDDGLSWQQIWTTPNKIYNALEVDPTDAAGKTVLFGTFAYNLYRMTYYSESAELTGSGQTRTGTLNNAGTVVKGFVTFTSANETFTDNQFGILTGSAGGTGTINYTSGAYSLTFSGTPSATTATYYRNGYVSATNYIFENAYDSKGHPYAGGTASGAVLYKSITNTYGDSNGAWGTWILMKRFFPTNVTNTILDPIVIDPRNDNRVAVAAVNGNSGSINGNRIFITPDAHKNEKATWYDITGDMPSPSGCSSLAFDYSQGIQGYLLCGTTNGLFAIDLQDSVPVEPNMTGIGVE